MRPQRISRRGLLAAGAALAFSPRIALSAEVALDPPALAHPVGRTARPVRIGVIGSGRIGTLYGEMWSKAGHAVLFSDRDPAAARTASGRSPGSRTGTAAEAAAFGEVVLISVPYAAMPSIGREHGRALRGKVIIDTSNPVVGRDGAEAQAWIDRGAGLSTAALIPGARVVRAFNILNYVAVAREAGRPGAKVGVAIGGDDAAAVALAAQLVRDAGLDPVAVPGGLAGTRRFDLGTPALQGKVLTAAEVRRALSL